MFGSKIISVTDKVYDYNSFSELKFTSDDLVVDDHRVRVKVNKFSKNMIASLKYVLLELMPTKRLVLSEEDIDTDEMKVMHSCIVQELRMAKVASDCPYDSFKLNYKYVDKPVFDPVTSKTFKYVNTRNIVMFNESNPKAVSDKKYVNAMDFCAIEFGKFISISGRIEEHNSYSANSLYKYITTEFKRDLTDGHNGVVGYYDGEFEFHYIDNKTGKQVLVDAFKILIEIIESIQNSESQIKLVLGGCVVEVPNDRSGVISYLIDVYILMQTKTNVIQVNKISQNGKTIMNFEDITIEDLKIVLDRALSSLVGELKNLIRDLK